MIILDLSFLFSHGHGLRYCAGFNSFYLYKRFYRCNTSLDGFSFDNGNVERRKDISLDEFSKEYDAKKPVRSNHLHISPWMSFL